jgi:hypothetical protein
VLRKELSILSRFRPGVGDAVVFDDHVRLVTDHLLRHDDEEDEFHFRVLRERAPEVRDLLDRLADEPALEAVHARLASPSAGTTLAHPSRPCRSPPKGDHRRRYEERNSQRR